MLIQVFAAVILVASAQMCPVWNCTSLPSNNGVPVCADFINSLDMVAIQPCASNNTFCQASGSMGQNNLNVSCSPF